MIVSTLLAPTMAGGRALAQRIVTVPARLHSTSLKDVGDEQLPDAPTAQTDCVTVTGTPRRFLLDELHFVQFP